MKVSTKIFSASATTAMLFAQNTEGKRIAKIVPVGGADQQFTVPNGTWTLAIIGWDGTNAFEGTASCFTKTQTLTGTAVTVDAELQTSNCSAAVFGGVDNFLATSGFKQLAIIACNDLSGIAGPAAACDGINRGFHRSFKIQTNEYDQTSSQATTVAMESSCISAGSDGSFTNTVLRLPQAQSGLISFSIKAYEDSNCTNSGSSTSFDSGFNSSDIKSFTDAANLRIYFSLKGALQTTKLYVENGSGYDTGYTPFKPVKLNLNANGGPILFKGAPDMSSLSPLVMSHDLSQAGSTSRVLPTSTNPDGEESMVDLVTIGNVAFFTAKSQSNYTWDLFRFDGGAAVNVLAATAPGSTPALSSGVQTKLVNFGTTIYFGWKADENADQKLCSFDSLTSVTDCSNHNAAFNTVVPILATNSGVIYRANETADSNKLKLFSLVLPSAHNLLYDLWLEQTFNLDTFVDTFFGLTYLRFFGSSHNVVVQTAGLTFNTPAAFDSGSEPFPFDGMVAFLRDGQPKFISGGAVTEIDSYLSNPPFLLDTGPLGTYLLGSVGPYLYLSTNRGVTGASQNLFVISAVDHSITQLTNETGSAGVVTAILNGDLYFMIHNGSAGLKLFKATGSTVTSVMLVSPNPQIAQQMTAIDGKIYFTADDGVNGNEPWVSDGTPGGTFMLKDLEPGSGSSDVKFAPKAVHGYVFMKNSSRMWRTRGIPDSTELQFYLAGFSIGTSTATSIDDGYLMTYSDPSASTIGSFYIKGNP